ncbi:hypothetical protein ACWKW9_19625 [Rhizobium daejeonense]
MCLAHGLLKTYLFYACMFLIVVIVLKWDLIDPKTLRLKLSDEGNRIGYALLGIVFLAVIIINVWPW